MKRRARLAGTILLCAIAFGVNAAIVRNALYGQPHRHDLKRNPDVAERRNHAEQRINDAELTPSEIRRAQRALAALGFYRGRAEGRINDASESAAKEFLRLVGQPPDRGATFDRRLAQALDDASAGDRGDAIRR